MSLIHIFAVNLRFYRTEAGLSQEKLAEWLVCTELTLVRLKENAETSLLKISKTSQMP